MKRFSLLAIVFVSSFSAAFAQNEKKPEFFAGYSFETVDTGVTSTDLGTATSLDNRFKANGFNLSAADYFTKHFGVAADFSAHFDNRGDSVGADTTQSKFSLYNITAGPQFRFAGTGRLTPFVHVLAGVARRNLTETVTSTATSNSDNTTSFAMNIGGGLDYRLNHRFALRLFQFDYNPIFLRSRIVDTITFPNQTLSGFRFSTGLVIK